MDHSYTMDGQRQEEPGIYEAQSSPKVNFLNPCKEVDLGLMKPGQSRRIFDRDSRFRGINPENQIPETSTRHQNKTNDTLQSIPE